MNLVWHIVRKDARLLRWPWVVWLASFFAVALWLRVARPTDFWPWDDLTQWLSLLGLVSGAAMVLQLLFCAVLTGVMLLEDPLAEPNALWQTRPLAPARLLAAKVATIILLFVLAPLGVLLPIWLSAGFGVAEMGEAALEVASAQALAAGVGLVAGVLTRNLVQFFFTALGLGLVVVIAQLPRVSDRIMLPPAQEERRALILLLVCGAGALLAVGWGVLRRRQAVARILIAGTAVFVVGLRFGLDRFPWQPQDERVARETRNIGELPLRADAELADGAGRLRILAVSAPNERRLIVLLDERDVWQARRDGAFVGIAWVRGIATGDWLSERFGARNGVDMAVQRGYSLATGEKAARLELEPNGAMTTARYGLMRTIVSLTCELPEGVDARKLAREGTALVRVRRVERKVHSP